jgi:hypothetical protein
MFSSFFILMLGLWACDPKETEVVDPKPFSAGVSQGKLESTDLDEASGLVHSRSNANILWSHNDGGNSATLYLVKSDGKNLGTCALEGVTNRDWEDVAMISESGKNYVLVGDIGDNTASKTSIFIYKFEEPNLSTVSSPQNLTIPAAQIQKFEFTYPDGARDAEALMVDPINGDIYIVSKREDKVRVYRKPLPFSTTQNNILEKVTELNIIAVTAGDISADGKEILLKSYDKIYYWKRENTTTSISSLLQQSPQELNYIPELLGESIAWRTDGSGFYTVSEGSNVDLFFYKRN